MRDKNAGIADMRLVLQLFLAIEDDLFEIVHVLLVQRVGKCPIHDAQFEQGCRTWQ